MERSSPRYQLVSLMFTGFPFSVTLWLLEVGIKGFEKEVKKKIPFPLFVS